MKLTSLVDAVEDSLNQELLLLQSISNDIYTREGAGHFRSTVGMHVRHNLDHFTAFFSGMSNGQVDYETRVRDTSIETDQAIAIDLIIRHRDSLHLLRSEEDKEISVREESDAGSVERRWLSSSTGRELQFLLGHTVHHHAIIAMIIDRLGVAIPDGFGVAPSTERHKSQSQTVG